MIQMITGGCILKQPVILAPEVDGGQQHPEQSRVIKRGAGETLYVNPWYAAAPGHNDKHVFAGTTRIGTKLEMLPMSQPAVQQTAPIFYQSRTG